MLTVFAISHAPALLLLDLSGYRLPNALLLLYLMIVVQISDVLQYVFGKLFGLIRLSPAISPSKTVEGLLGGGLTAVLIGAGRGDERRHRHRRVLRRLCPVGD